MSSIAARGSAALAVAVVAAFWLNTWFLPRAKARCGRTPVLSTGVDLMTVDGVSLNSPTRVAVGPKGRIWIAEQHGLIRVFQIEKGRAGFRIAGEETIEAIQELPNHDDDGSPRPDLRTRLVTGLTVEAGADGLVAYVASSDPRIDNPDIDSNSGVISRLRKVGGSWLREDLVRGLPRSKSDHATNAIVARGPRPESLYVLQGANTNAGAPSRMFFDLPEYALSGALLEIDLATLEAPLDLPTLDDENRLGVHDANDPFGGAEGRNQAVLDPTLPLRLYATGLRNPYDMVWTEAGFWVTDNGANQNYGGAPIADEQGRWSNAPVEDGNSLPDVLYLINRKGLQFGHPNPTRDNPDNVFNAADPQSPVRAPWHAPSTAVEPGRPLVVFEESTNGVVWLDHAGLDSSWRQTLVAVDLRGTVWRIGPMPQGPPPVERTLVLQSSRMLLDIAVAQSHAQFDSIIWAVDYGAGDLLAIDLAASERGALWAFTRSAVRFLPEVGCSLMGLDPRSKEGEI